MSAMKALDALIRERFKGELEKEADARASIQFYLRTGRRGHLTTEESKLLDEWGEGVTDGGTE